MERRRPTPFEAVKKMVMPLAIAGITVSAYTLGDLYISSVNRMDQVENLSLPNASPEELAQARTSLNKHSTAHKT